MDIHALTEALRSSRGFAHKTDISDVMAALGGHHPGGVAAMAQAVAVGDDCAALPSPGGGYTLLAIEGMVEDFIAAQPWFAGYCSVMVNVSDVAAMGGRPLAVVDALWSSGMDQASEMLAGMAAAAQRYGVPIVGGHSNNRARGGQLAVAILGHAQRLLSSFDARPGDALVMAIDLRGAWQEPYPYWNASTSAPAERLRGDLALLPEIAEAGLCDAAKDISMAGAIGTALMLTECSGVGARIDVDAIPRPPGMDDGAALLRWLTAFPSFGFVLSVRPAHLAEVQARFRARGLACAAVGTVTDTPTLVLAQGGSEALLWDTRERPFITAPAAVAEVA
ncbi:MAG TPA: sll0787 family AIR synthase-like protein [Burkholderiaceae bacterium]